MDVMCGFPSLPQQCVLQIFDTREVMVTQNTTLAEEFATNLRLIFQHIQTRIGQHTLLTTHVLYMYECVHIHCLRFSMCVCRYSTCTCTCILYVHVHSRE